MGHLRYSTTGKKVKKIDFSPKAGIKKLTLTNGKIYAGDAVKDLKDSDSFVFLFQTPVM